MSKLAIVLLIAAAAVACVSGAAVPGDTQEFQVPQEPVQAIPKDQLGGLLPPGFGNKKSPPGDTQEFKVPKGPVNPIPADQLRGLLPPGVGGNKYKLPPGL